MIILICAKKRLKNLYSKLKYNLELLKRYNEIFIEQKESGMIEEAADTAQKMKFSIKDFFTFDHIY